MIANGTLNETAARRLSEAYTAKGFKSFTFEKKDLTKMEKGETYKFRVAGANKLGKGEWSKF